MTSTVDLIIPTFNNRDFLQPCVLSLLLEAPTTCAFRVLVVNNGQPESCEWLVEQRWPPVEVVQSGGRNLGWEGALKLGLARSDSPYVIFCNDDIHIPPSSRGWVDALLRHFNDDRVAAVGPSSNMVMGIQNIFAVGFPPVAATRLLIGFCLAVRRSALDEVGGIDDTLPGGDDFDLGFRLRQAGYRLIADRRVFIFHHGFKTGERIHGGASQPGGWNSLQMQEATKLALIRKYGLAAWDETVSGAWEAVEDTQPGPENCLA